MGSGLFSKVAVLGAGAMGHGIAELIALSGRTVVLRDIEQPILDKARQQIVWSLDKLVEKGEIDGAQRDKALDGLVTTTDLAQAVRSADLVIEAVPEDMGLKKRIFKEVDGAAHSHAVLASNTSSLSISEMARATGRPTKVAGLHFFNPPIKMALVEVVRGEQTDPAVIDDLVRFVKDLGKEPIVVKKDIPGFIVNRVIGAYMLEGARLLDEGKVTKESLDACMRFNVGFPMGPFELMDYTGLDVISKVCESMGQSVPRCLKNLVDQKKFGRKSGGGFYEGTSPPKLTPDQGAGVDPWLVLAPVVNAAAWLVQEGITTPVEMDWAMRLGTGFPDGPFTMADRYGLERVVTVLQSQGQQAVPLLSDKVKKGDLFHARPKAAAESAHAFKTIALEVKDHVAWLTLNRPDRLNTLNPEMMGELEEALRQLASNDDVRVLLLRGAGEKAFCAGADITSFAGSKQTMMLTRQDVFTALAEFPKPTVAAIHGYCLGGGMELAIACDFRIVREDATLGQTEVNLGLIPGGGGTQRLVSLIGLARAKELVLLGKRITADEAYRHGVATEIVSKDRFEQAVEKFAERLAKGAPLALKAAKQLLDRAGGPDQALLEAERLAFAILMQTDDAAEGVGAFLSKSEPKFKGE